MAAGVLQGVPVTTSDIDFWIGLPPGEHDRVLNCCHKIGVRLLTDHVVELEDGTLLNFAYQVDGLHGFEDELGRAKRMHWLSSSVPVLALGRLIKSKEAAGRPKDKVHLVIFDGP